MALFVVVPFTVFLLGSGVFSPKNRKSFVALAAGLFVAQTLAAIYLGQLLAAGLPGLEALSAYFKFSIDAFSQMALALSGLVLFVALIVGRLFFEEEAEKLYYFTNMLCALCIGMNAVVMATDLFSLYVFIEVVSISSFILVALTKEKSGLEGSFKYFILSAVASVFMLMAIGIFLLCVPDLTFASVKTAIALNAGSGWVKAAVLLFIAGLFIKAGVVPFHGWLPDAYEGASAPVSVVLGGIATKISGVYGLVRVVATVFSPEAASFNDVFLALGTVSIIVGALGAIGQDRMKRLLAYSSISQIGYIVVALGVGTPFALAGAAFHFFNHAIFKSLLFVNSAALERQFGTTELSQLKGRGNRLFSTQASSLVALLSTAGVPPLSGFWSKLVIIMALWASGHTALAIVALLASILTAAYFLILQRRIFFVKEEPSDEVPAVSVTPSRQLVSLETTLATITVVVGLLAPFFLSAWIFPMRF